MFMGEQAARPVLDAARGKLSVPEVAVRARVSRGLWQGETETKGAAVPVGGGVAEGWSALDKLAW
jgi:hypothetical protein